MRLSETDKDHIEEAVARAETATSGEIFCMVTGQASDYRETRLAWAAALALAAPALLALILAALPWTGGLGGGWQAGHATATELAAKASVGVYALTQAVVFAAIWLALSHPRLRRWATPRALKRQRLHHEAMRQFLAKGLHLTRARTGVLIIAALDDRQAEIVADDGIHAKVTHDVWADAVEALVRGMREGLPADGFVAAVERCGAVLAEHFPPSDVNPDELANRLVEI